MKFEDLYERHFDVVWSSLRRLGVPVSDLPDVTQEVFVVVHRRLPEFEERAKLTTWLFRICHHAARDRARRAHVRREIADGRSAETVLEPRDGAERLLERRDDVELFQVVLDGMNEEQRAVFVMFELSEMTGEEIAETCEIPLGTVYSRLRLAREAFRTGVTRVMARRASGALRRQGAS